MSRSHTPSVPGTPTTDGPALTLADTFGRYTTSQNVVDLFARRIKDRFIVVTGASPGGIGYETARAIATKEPALLVLAGRDRSKLEQSRDEIHKESPGAHISLVTLDLNSLASVKKAAHEISLLGHVDVLINNAAVMMCPYHQTEEGFESQFGSNYVAPWLLTNLLMPSMLKSTHRPRVVFVSSNMHRASDIRWHDFGFHHGKKYDKVQAYGQSKTAGILNAVALVEIYPKKLTAISVHPGAIKTNLQRHMTAEDMEMMKPFFNEDGSPKFEWKSIPEGAATTLVAAFDPRMDKANGSYLVDCQVAKTVPSDGSPESLLLEGVAPYAINKTAAAKLWDHTNNMTGQTF